MDQLAAFQPMEHVAVPPDVQLRVTRQYMEKITSILDGGSKINPPEVRGPICSLFRSSLAIYPNSQLMREFLHGEEVVVLVRRLANVTGDANFVLAGVEAALKVRHPVPTKFANLMADMLQKWFADFIGIEIRPGFVFIVLSIISLAFVRQRESHFNGEYIIADLDKSLLPLIEFAIDRETAQSINEGSDFALNPLHIASQYALTSVVRILLKHEDIDVNAKDTKGSSAFHLLMTTTRPLRDEHVSIAKLLLSIEDIEIFAKDNQDKTAIDVGIQVTMSFPNDISITLDIIQLVMKQPSTTAEMIQKTFADIVVMMVPPNLQAKHLEFVAAIVDNTKFSTQSCQAFGNMDAIKYCLSRMALDEIFVDGVAILRALESVVGHETADTKMLGDAFQSLCSLKASDASGQSLLVRVQSAVLKNANFDVNSKLNSAGHTVAHICAEKKLAEALEAILQLKNFEPNTQDAVGNPVLFYICSNFEPYVVKKYLNDYDIQWNFEVKNVVGQNAYEYCKVKHSDPVVQGLLREKSPNTETTGKL